MKFRSSLRMPQFSLSKSKFNRTVFRSGGFNRSFASVLSTDLCIYGELAPPKKVNKHARCTSRSPFCFDQLNILVQLFKGKILAKRSQKVVPSHALGPITLLESASRPMCGMS